MDLGAYANIDTLEGIMKSNNIEVPRLRGLRLMRDEKPISKDDIDRAVADSIYGTYGICQQFCMSVPRWTDSDTHCSSWESDKVIERYMIKGPESTDTWNDYVGFRWNLLHGKPRKRLKLAIKHKEREVREQWRVWNKYAGRDDVLYIHARIGGWNWGDYGGNNLAREPWFLEKVDDCFDSTYCDIYAKIEPVKELMLKEFEDDSE